MATILLSAAGAAIGGSVGGTLLGVSAAAVGRLAGATLGRAIDQRIMGNGAEAVEQGQIERFRLTGSGEGDPIAQVYGRMRVGGHVIWATNFAETVSVSGGGKGAPRPTVRNYSYTVSLAVAVCEGEITSIGRIWADGSEIARDSLNMRVYTGAKDQLPDPKMEAVEGAGNVPAYRGTAYVVFEDLPLEQFGNRVPQFSFEVVRPAQPGTESHNTDPSFGIQGVAMMPGSGEYALATTPVHFSYGAGQSALANVNSPSGKSDYATSLEALSEELPNCGSVSLIVSWFGNDLRAAHCDIKPKVEQTQFDGQEMPWAVAGEMRSTADLVPFDPEGRPIYGGTPADASVIEAIQATQAGGQGVMYYPFILMDQVDGNSLPDPYSGAAAQPKLPWRGRITLMDAPGQAGSSDATAAAEAEVAAFFGTATAADFAISGETVSYSGPDEWRYNRFILHQAALCAAAGGVEAFCIGSEMRGLTQIRGANGSFPAVTALIDLAAQCRAILGPQCKIGYAADWTEYFGYQPQDGSGDRYFHLDPLWADANIDFVGIDNYMPLSDWRDGTEHSDSDWGTIYNLDYLKDNIEGGEGYDWYYHSVDARAAQIRTPITDGDHGEPWVYRYKDIKNWWLNAHHERIGGLRQSNPTAWEPMSKPVWFTELGCAAVDKGTNQPNKFLDPKSSESSLPRYSNGRRDELMQMQYLRAMFGYWNDPANNPVSEVYGAPMLDMSRAHVWAWDARPYPFFPNNRGFWSDGDNYARGHWMTGRSGSRPLSDVVAEICKRAGVASFDVSELYGYLRGYTRAEVAPARTALQPLMLRYGFDAVERGGTLKFIMRDGLNDIEVSRDEMAVAKELDGLIEETRTAEAELTGRVRMRFVQAEGDFDVVAEEAVLPDEATHAVAATEVPLSLTRAEGRQVVERWLSEARVARDVVRFALPPSKLPLGAGDILRLDNDGVPARYRIDRVEQGDKQLVEAVRIEPETYRPIDMADDAATVRAFTPPLPVFPLFLDLPLMTGEEVPHAPHLAVTAEPWPGTAALYASGSDAGYSLDQLISTRSTLGVTETAMFAASMGIIDHGEGLVVKLTSGALSGIDDEALLNGGNLMAIGDGSAGNWELFQFRDAQLVGENTYLLKHRLRGQLGSDVLMPSQWPAGSYVVALDGIPQQITLAASQRNIARHYRIGPAQRSYDDPSFVHRIEAFDGVGLRPYAPVHLRADPIAGGDYAISWIRRTRIAGDGWDTIEVPLGEESESYLLQIRLGGALVREQILTVPSWTYSAAMQVADGTAGGFEVTVAQISASYGAGAKRSLAVA
ncbi:glycoside hydrolase TIM-barrel-like domain-containing protein [Litorivita sp. NS0012-18]|uniref:baseplate multidomain protein megatron n=1 Tax=Litorivita sp. NS0012-18 TaxID=3127655 RepID=UPI0031058909